MKDETEKKDVTVTDGKPMLCEVLTIEQKRQLAAESFERSNIVYRHICRTQMMRSDFKDGSGYGIFSGSRNYDDVFVKFDKLNERQKLLLSKWGLLEYLT